MEFDKWWKLNYGKHIQPNSNVKNACRFAFNDSHLLGDFELKRAKAAIDQIDIILTDDNPTSMLEGIEAVLDRYYNRGYDVK